MKQTGAGLGVALLALACCAGPFLVLGLVAAVGTAAVIGGGVALAAAVAVGLALLAARRALLRRREVGCAVPKRGRQAPPAKMG